jgi:hypothetical protein
MLDHVPTSRLSFAVKITCKKPLKGELFLSTYRRNKFITLELCMKKKSSTGRRCTIQRNCPDTEEQRRITNSIHHGPEKRNDATPG